MHPVDRDLLLLVNGLIGRSATAFETVLLMCGQIPLIICVMTLLVLWWTDTEGKRAAPVLGGFVLTPPGLRESRCRVVALSLAVAVAFMTTRLIARATELPRPLGREPLLVPIDALRWDGMVQGMTGFGAFPSDHAALFFALATGLFFWNRTSATVGLGVAAVFSLARVAVGFHYPSDMVAGAAVGVVAATVTLRSMSHFARPLHLVVALFERAPSVMYPLMFVAAIDFTNHFRMMIRGVFGLLFKLVGLAGSS